MTVKMNPKISFGFRVIFVLWMGGTGILAMIDLIYPSEPIEIKVCIDYDEFLNYCNEYEMQVFGGDKPTWLNVMFIAMTIMIVLVNVPRLKTDYKKLRYGYRSTWDDEFRK